MRTLTIIAAALFLPLIAHAEYAASPPGVLEIKVSNIENGSGTLHSG